MAAEKITGEGLARIILLGNKEEIFPRAKKWGVSLEDIMVFEHRNSPRFSQYAHIYWELRKHKGITPEDACCKLHNPLYYATMMVRQGEADGVVAGAQNTTAEVIRATIPVIGMTPGTRWVSSFFIMVVPDCPYGENGAFIFADGGIIPDPTAEQLASIAISSAQTAQELLGWEPRIAMISFSTKGSARHPLVDKVIAATQMILQQKPLLVVDGEIQVDAALVKEVALRKCPDSPVGGKANILIFPDLNVGNTAYKLVERLARAKAWGPLLQGLVRPASDLSRGCTVDTIVNVVAITAVRAGIYENSSN